ncbi:MAG: hypothetical protein HOE90_24180 [Bacteriovoracaceae bacterium]|jgi:hypothetical protein|nr:hypothetical protein [Bacteriovoracaceae bacterium]
MEERIKLTEKSYALGSENLKKFGVTEEAIQLANASVKSMTKIVSKSKELGSMLKLLLKNKASYRFNHCQLISCVAFHMVYKMPWSSKEQTEKISYVAYFHDILLESDEEVKIHTNSQLSKLYPLNEDEQRVKQHALQAAELTLKFPNIPIGVDTIIKQHHGIKSGVGFMETPPVGLAPLAVLFIIAECFVHHLLEKGVDNINRVKIFEEMKEKYDDPKFHQAIEALKHSDV